jgi:hypothetical protein
LLYALDADLFNIQTARNAAAGCVYVEQEEEGPGNSIE